MPRRGRHPALARLILVVAGGTIDRRPLGSTCLFGRPQHHVPLLFGQAEATSVRRAHRPRTWGFRAWGSQLGPHRRQNSAAESSCAQRGLSLGDVYTCETKKDSPLWLRVRGGAESLKEDEDTAKTRVGDGIGESMGDVGRSKQDNADAAVADDGADDYMGLNGAAGGRDNMNEDSHEQLQTEPNEAGQDSAEVLEDLTGVDTASEAGTAPSASVSSKAVVAGLGEVLPAMLKSGAAFFMGSWLAKRLSPSVAQQVRAARIIYTGYLIFSQAVCMYIRYLIWRKDDDTEVVVPPPPQLKKMMDGIGGAGGGPDSEAKEAAGAATAAATAAASAGAAGAGGAAAALAPLFDKMLSSRTPAKKYDMKTIQAIRRGHFWASLFMCYTHLKRGMIRPMMLQVAFGLLSLLDSPLFKIYVLGREAEGTLGRPFKKQGLMASLSGPMEGLAAKAEEARRAAEAQATEAGDATSGEEASFNGSGDDQDEDRGDGDDDEAMPDIRDLTDADDEEIDTTTRAAS